MRYHQIFEADDGVPDALKELFPQIKAECGEVLKGMRMTRETLWRGSRAISVGEVKRLTPRNDRQSLAKLHTAQTKVDEWLVAQGFTALRSNSFFCDRRRVSAAYYGPMCIAIPVDGFAYTWYRGATDLFNLMSGIEAGADVNEIMEIASPTKDDFWQAKGEIQIHGSMWLISASGGKDIPILKYLRQPKARSPNS